MVEIKRESFIFYKSFFDAAKGLPEVERTGFYNAMCEYIFENKSPTMETASAIVISMFALVKPQLDKNIVRYINGCKGAEFGKLGGRPQKQEKTPKKPLNNPKETPNVNLNDNSKDNINISMSISEAKIDTTEIIKLFNEICLNLPKVLKITDKRKHLIKSVQKTVAENGGFEALFKKVAASDFLNGRDKAQWYGCSFDWILKSENIIKIFEGNYDNKSCNLKSSKPDYSDVNRYKNQSSNW